ncbi:MAG: carboxylating nicotinate-nucleotide diphosphorylase [Actinomycetota bacterium]|nr:carboxylating nicotinate-nucleotide diphosphorylase [Actinomycetota bacterium]
MISLKKSQVMDLIRRTLSEDLAGFGDITSKYLLPSDHHSQAYIWCKQDMAVLCGINIAGWLMEEVDSSIKLKMLKKDGDMVSRHQKVATLSGPTASLLAAERSALNFIQHLSGIATITKKFSNIASAQGVKIVDTRKTKPNLRLVEKYAVETGGGYNHRFGLFDGIMLKDNHIRAAGGIIEAVKAIKGSIPHPLKIEVEVQDSSQLQQAITAQADIIMLDNMNPDQIEESVKKIRSETNKNTLIEVSGNITLNNLEDYCNTGIDLISTGYITHSAPAADFSMEFI